MQRREYLGATGALTALVAGGVGTPVAADRAAAITQPEQFELVSVEAPDEVEVMTPFTYAFTVANRSDTDREFWGYLTVATPTAEGTNRIGLSIPAGEEVTVETNTAHAPYVGPYRYTLPAFDASFEIEATPAYRGVGETWRSPEDIVLRVDEIELTDTYEYEDFEGETAEETAPEGSQWAFVWVYARNAARESTYLPFADDISILADGQQFVREYISKEDGAYEGDEVSSGIEREGWIAYAVPAELGPADLEVDYTSDDIDGEWSTRWVTETDSG